MTKQLLLSIDNTVFNNDKELLDYVKQNFVSEIEGGNIELNELIDELQKAFPNFTVNVENGKGWHCDYKIFVGNDLMKFEERLGNSNNPHKDYHPNPEKIDQVIERFIKSKSIVEYIINGVNKIADFKIRCTEHSYGYSPDEESYDFVYEVDGEERWSRFYPYNISEDGFIKEFHQHVVTKLEGVLKSVNDDGYFVGYKIDGVPVNAFQGKKVRLEVIE